MFNWYKKEKPFGGFAGFGGGATGLGFAGGAAAAEATGGVINEYTDGSTKYRAHIFTTPGTFELVSGDVDLQYMVIGGGGSGGSYNGGAGGSGSVTSNHPDMPAPLRGAALPISGPVSYIVTVGRGGAHSNGVDGQGGSPNPAPVGNPANVYPFAQADHESQGRLGENSSLGPNIVARGGGGGAGYNTGTKAVRGPGGSGGGGSYGIPGGPGDAYTSNPSPVGPGAGNAGGYGYPSPQYCGGGGGGAGGAGNAGNPGGDGDSGHGGLGLRIRIAGGDNPTYTAAGRIGPDGTYQWYAGGGGAGRFNSGPTSGGGPGSPPTFGWAGAGRGGGPANVDGFNAIQGTGSGGGGGGDTASLGGAGGSGIVVVRYEIPSTKTAKATGGNVSFYNGKTIHTFLQPGTFTVSGTTITDAEIVIVGGGGGSGGDSTGAIYGTGGGGAGEVVISTTLQTLPSSTPYGVTVGQGGKGGQSYPGRLAGDQGEPSTFGPFIAHGGGGGGGGGAGQSGGSGGGGAQYGPGNAGGPVGAPVNSGEWTSYMNAGGAGGQAHGAGGGGGAGTSGRDAFPDAGSGGLGIQLPTTFRDPSQSIGMPGPDGSKFWVAGGGGGAAYANQDNPGTNGGTGPARSIGGPFSGGGNSGVGPVPGTYYGNQGAEGWANTGGGAGGTHTSGAGASTYPGAPGSRGGSGIVLVAYPT